MVPSAGDETETVMAVRAPIFLLSVLAVTLAHTGCGAPVARHIAGGSMHTCAIKDDNSVWCWGANFDGQLGFEKKVVELLSPARVTADWRLPIEVNAGDRHTCIRNDQKHVWCWGTIGGGGNWPVVDIPTRVDIHDVSGLILGDPVHQCVVKTDRTAWCWGANSWGVVGDETVIDRPKPTQVKDPTGQAFLKSVKAIAGSDATNTCALTTDTLVYCWGWNFYGQLGNGMLGGQFQAFPLPTPVLTAQGGPRLRGVHEIAMTSNVACARKEDGTVWCWGNVDGTVNGKFPSPVQIFNANGTPFDKVTALSGAGRHFCALKSDGTSWCWGLGQNGEFGNGAFKNDFLHPQQSFYSSGLRFDPTEHGPGGVHSCAYNSHNGHFFCWGFNLQGQIGNGMKSGFNQLGPNPGPPYPVPLEF